MIWFKLTDLNRKLHAFLAGRRWFIGNTSTGCIGHSHQLSVETSSILPQNIDGQWLLTRPGDDFVPEIVNLTVRSVGKTCCSFTTIACSSVFADDGFDVTVKTVLQYQR